MSSVMVIRGVHAIMIRYLKHAGSQCRQDLQDWRSHLRFAILRLSYGNSKKFQTYHMESHWNARSAYFKCLEVEIFIPSKVEIPCRVPHCLSLTLIRQCTLSKQCNTDTNPTCAIWENIVDSMGFTPFGSLKILLCEFYGLETSIIIRMTI